jgi:hypothetical protein
VGGIATGLIAVLLLALASPTRVSAQPASSTPTPPRLVFEITDGGTVPAPPDGLPAALRVRVRATDLDAAGASPRVSGPWRVWLTVEDLDAADLDAASWADRWRRLLAGLPPLAAVELQAEGADPRRTAFLIKLSAAEVRAARPDVPIVLGGAATARLDDVLTSDVRPSVDALALPDGVDAGPAWTWANQHDPGLPLLELGAFLGDGLAPSAFVQRELTRLGGQTFGRGYRLSSSALRALVPVLDRLRDLYAGDLAPVATTADSLSLRSRDTEVTASRSWRLLYNLATLGTYLVVDSTAPAGERLDVSVVLPSAGAVVVRDPVSGRDRAAVATTRDDATQRTRATLPLPRPGAWLVDFNRGAEAGFIQQEDVTAARSLTVEEILARHQAQQAAERDLAPRYVVDGRIQQYFRPSLTDPGYDVVTVNRFFVDRVEGTEWEEREFSVNGAKFGEPRPPFPLLQPEKVLSPPLVIELDARYRYRLQGTETIDGRAAWMVAFEPQVKGQSLYRGTVWIDRETYARLRQQAVQTNLGAPVISNDETQDFAPVRTSSGREVYLPSRLYNQQLILIAGRNLLVERRISFSNYEIAPTDFAAQRQQARSGSRTMYRDTDKGVRYLVKEGDERVVSDIATTRAKALALGLTIDPGFEFPLPIGGINYLNFRFMGRQDTQVAVLFAGVLAAGNIQRPKALFNRIDASVDFFAIAPPSSDRLFVPGGERQDERLLTWPLSTGLNLGWQLNSHHRVSTQYLFRFDGYVRDRTTAEDYVTPSTTVTNGLGLLYEFRRGGYSLTANGVYYRRAAWRPWGEPRALAATPPAYVKYQAAATKVFYLGPFSKVVINGAWFGGHDLDRFSQYQFGLFDDTRIHGVPAAGVRYGELGVVRGQYSFNLFEQYRFDVFADRGWGRVRSGGVPGVVEVPWEPLTGVGAAFNFRVPGKTMILRGEVGKSFLASRYDGLGSTTFQLMLLKPL